MRVIDQNIREPFNFYMLSSILRIAREDEKRRKRIHIAWKKKVLYIFCGLKRDRKSNQNVWKKVYVYVYTENYVRILKNSFANNIIIFGDNKKKGVEASQKPEHPGEISNMTDA